MRRPPRLVARTLAVTFMTVAIILSLVFMVLMVDARDRVRAGEIEKLSVAERVFTALEARRQQEQLATIATVAENPTLEAALDTYFTESRFSGLTADQETSLRDTVVVEAEKLAALTRADVLAILDATGTVFASAGPSRERWPRYERIVIPAGGSSTFHDIVVLPQGAFRIAGAALRLVDRDVGALADRAAVVGQRMEAGDRDRGAPLRASGADRGQDRRRIAPLASWVRESLGAPPAFEPNNRTALVALHGVAFTGDPRAAD